MSIQQQQNHIPLIKRLVVITIGMFGFGFALVPLYDVFCEITGINGKTRTEAVNADRAVINQQREVTI